MKGSPVEVSSPALAGVSFTLRSVEQLGRRSILAVLTMESFDWGRRLFGAPVEVTVRRGCVTRTIKGVVEAVKLVPAKATANAWLVTIRLRILPSARASEMRAMQEHAATIRVRRRARLGELAGRLRQLAYQASDVQKGLHRLSQSADTEDLSILRHAEEMLRESIDLLRTASACIDGRGIDRP